VSGGEWIPREVYCLQRVQHVDNVIELLDYYCDLRHCRFIIIMMTLLMLYVYTSYYVDASNALRVHVHSNQTVLRAAVKSWALAGMGKQREGACPLEMLQSAFYDVNVVQSLSIRSIYALY